MIYERSGLRSFDGAILRKGEVRTIASTAMVGTPARPVGFGAALIHEGPNEYDVPALADHVMFVMLGKRPLVSGRVHGGRPFQTDALPWRLWLLPAQGESWWQTEAGSPILHLHFSPDDLVSWFGHTVTSGGLRPVLNEDDAVVRRLARALAFELESKQPGGLMMIEGLALQIGAHLLRTYGTSQMPAAVKGGLAPWQLRRVVEMMADQLSGHVGLDALAEAVRLSRFHFLRAFKATTGLPPHRYLINLRMEHAQMLLETTKLPVADIAARVGYGAPQAFAQLFRRETGWSPTDYRSARGG